MMLDMILPTTTSLSRPSSTSLTGEAQAGLPGSSGANVFAQLLQAVGDVPVPLQTVTMPWPNETELGDRQLLTQMIAENSGFAAPAIETTMAEALREALGDEAALLLDEGLPAAELPEEVELADQAIGTAQLIVASPQAAATASATIAAATQPSVPRLAMQLEAVPAHAEAVRNLNPMTAPAVTAANLDGLPPALAGEAPLGQSTQEPLPAVSTGQPATASTLSASQTATQSAGLNAPLSTPAWGRELGQHVVIAARADEQHISLRLNPANLGPLQIELKVLDQQAQVQFLSPHAQVRGAVEQAIPQLREALAEQGITLADTSVGEQRQQQQNTGSDRPSSHAGHSTAEAQSDDATIVAAPTQPLADGRINVYV